MAIARVFPRRTKATPIDALAFSREPQLEDFSLVIDKVHVSVTFTADLPRAEKLARLWSGLAPVEIGGPATGQRGENFVPGMYLKPGYVITSRGCPNRCWFCSVPKREGGKVRELPITSGWNVLDDNLLACSQDHITAVAAMLRTQPRRPTFTGGIEAARLSWAYATMLHQLKPKVLWFAYDTPNDYEPLIEAGKLLRRAGFTTASHTLCCYVLIGWRGDTMDRADVRLTQTIKAGFYPQAMLYRSDKYTPSIEWRRFQRTWASKRIVGSKMRQLQDAK